MKQTYVTPNFIKDLTDSKLILGFRAHLIYVQDYQNVNIKDIPKITDYRYGSRVIAETVNLSNNNDTLMISVPIPTLSYENFIVFTYKAFNKISLTSNDYPTIRSLLNAITFNEDDVAFVFKWYDNEENKLNLLGQLSQSSLKLFVTLSNYRVYSNIISLTDNSILHSHEFRIQNEDYDYTYLNIDSLNNITEYNTYMNNTVVPGYEYYNYTELVNNSLDFPYESFINDVDNKNNNGGEF